MNNEYMTINEAAKELQRSTSTVWRYIKEKHIATFKKSLARQVFVRREDIVSIGIDYQPRQNQNDG